MTDYLDLDDVLTAATVALGHAPEIRDAGLLESALHRPQATWYGEETYPDLDAKAAALLLSLVGNHALVDGNKRIGWVATRLFYVLNGHDLRAPHDHAFTLVMDIASGKVTDVVEVARAQAIWRVDPA